MIVHPDNPVEAFTSTNVVEIYIRSNPILEPVQPGGANSPGASICGVIRQEMMSGDIYSVDRAYRSGDAVLYLAPDPDAMLEGNFGRSSGDRLYPTAVAK
jgi:hypothetical protein